MINDAAIICSINGNGWPSDLIKTRAGILATITTGISQLKIKSRAQIGGARRAHN